MSPPYFFISYSREDSRQQRALVAGLRGRGLNVWVDIEHLIPGSPAWEREIERAIRGAAGTIVLLSPDANESEWVRREISFAEQHEKRIFPVLIRGDEDDSVPLRLSSHQRVDLRRDYESGMDELANALRDHLGLTKLGSQAGKTPGKQIRIDPAVVKRYALPGLVAIFGLACLAGLGLAARSIYSSISMRATRTPTARGFVVIAATDSNVQTATLSAADLALTETSLGVNFDPNAQPAGKIVYTCQIHKLNTLDQICIIGADGSGQRRLTESGSSDNQDASLSPDGSAVLFVSNRTGHYEIFEMDLSGTARRLTSLESTLGVPEVSPDNKWIIFTNRVGQYEQLWLMERDGKNPRKLFSSEENSAVAPTWSPDGEHILFALGKEGARQLYIMDLDGGEPRLLNSEIITPGRSDWSTHDVIAYYAGAAWKREVFIILPDGSGLLQVTQGGSAQSPSFSPDGNWIAYTAYTNVDEQDQLSCEIFIQNLASHETRRLTDNAYCDYQPRWGP